MDTYEAFVAERCTRPAWPVMDAGHCGQLLYGEVCELRTEVAQGRGMDVLLELGDVLFYLTRLAQLHGHTLGDVASLNVSKLMVRDEIGKKK